MSKSTITIWMLFRILNELNNACSEDRHYHIVLDAGYFHLCVDGKTIYQSFDAEDFFGRIFVEYCALVYPRKPGIFDWLR